MGENRVRYTGGCLCGALRYEAEGEPLFTGYCYCADCRKASGSGFIPFMGFASSAVRFSGETRQFWSRSFKGTDAVRNFCPVCGGLVFGGEVGKDDSHTIYAGSLDDPTSFHPQVAIFTRSRPAWVALPPGLRHHAGLSLTNLGALWCWTPDGWHAEAERASRPQRLEPRAPRWRGGDHGVDQRACLPGPTPSDQGHHGVPAEQPQSERGDRHR